MAIYSNTIGNEFRQSGLTERRMHNMASYTTPKKKRRKEKEEMKNAINISNFSGGFNNSTNVRDLSDIEFAEMLNLNNEIPGKLQPYGKHVNDSKCDAAISIDNVIYGSGAYHLILIELLMVQEL